MLTVQPGPPANDLPPAQSAKLWKSAQDFEAMTIGQLLQPMFDTVADSGPFGGGDTANAFKPVMVQAIGRAMEARGGLGLSGPIFQALLQAQGEKGPHTVPPVIPPTEPTQEQHAS